ncbi:ABC transporter permease [Clostridium felsineum]|uniref:Uncharacterized protein n=1 Tax=Clostridium felsineum TaxID=36839 RepID=A0A1S8MFN8_9CLOT|nr:ABC transporter permease [Clostridium felsineum]URZ05628.1 hypothetical protein CLROS_009540 [Clostridium felsineum]URZ10667.1 hypothetical protein CROST_013770 [Clostridium felsineum]
MRTVILICICNFKRVYCNKKKFFINLFVPIVAIILAMTVNYVTTPSLNIGVSIKGSNENNRIIRLLKRSKNVDIKIVQGTLYKTDVIMGKYDAVVKLKDNSNNVEVYSIKNKKTGEDIKKLIKAYASTNKPLNMENIMKNEQIGGLSEAERIIAFLFTVLLITSVINEAVIIRDREENTFYRFMYSPRSKFNYILGNVIYNYVFSYAQIFLASCIITICGVSIGSSLSKMLLYAMLFTLVITTLATLIVLIFNKELHANMFSAAISIILSLIGGTFISYSKMPKLLKTLSEITPNRWIIKSVHYIQGEAYNSINPMIVLVIFSIIFSLLAFIVNEFKKVEFKQ